MLPYGHSIMASSSDAISVKTTTVTTSSVPEGHDFATRTPEKLLGRLMEFNNHVEHIARVEAILMQNMGLSKDDAGVFIRAGVDAVFGKLELPVCRPEGHAVPRDENEGTWMNELRESFDEATYFIKKTKSVFVNLDRSTLTIRNPNHRVVPRLAMFNEKVNNKDVTFVEERAYNLQNADVFLLPLDVPVKIRWLCRFPIAIKLKNPAASTLENKTLVVEGGESDPRFFGKDYSTLILFARCDREKDEWFWRFMFASGKTPFPLTIPSVKLSPHMSPFNALFHRAFADFLVEPAWKTTIVEKIQAKLKQMKRPQYLEELTVSKFDFGNRLPDFGQVSDKIRIDRLGLWCEIDFELRGPLTVTLVTNLNMQKLSNPDYNGKGNGEDLGDLEEAERKKVVYSTLGNLYGGYESDEFDEETEIPEESKSKLMRFVETIAESKAFKYFSELGVVRRALENVTDTDLTLSVDIELIKGRLALNIPPPPSDRLWYGFLPEPEFKIKVSPRMGDKDVDFTMVTDWLEKKLVNEFHGVLTVPNMDDITIPFANSGIDPPEYRLSKLSDLILKLT